MAENQENITEGKHDFHLEARDGKGELIWVGGKPFNAKSKSWNSWSWHTFKSEIEEPGIWNISLFLDGVFLTELKVPVYRSEIEISNVKTDEIGFVGAVRMKELHKVYKDKSEVLKSCEAECTEMFQKGELKEGMDLKSCIEALCEN